MGSTYCPECSRVLTEGAGACPSCGFVLENTGSNLRSAAAGEASGATVTGEWKTGDPNAELRTSRPGFIYVLSNPSFGGNLSTPFHKYGDVSYAPRDCFVAPLLATTCPGPVVASEAKQSQGIEYATVFAT